MKRLVLVFCGDQASTASEAMDAAKSAATPSEEGANQIVAHPPPSLPTPLRWGGAIATIRFAPSEEITATIDAVKSGAKKLGGE